MLKTLLYYYVLAKHYVTGNTVIDVGFWKYERTYVVSF